MSTRLKTPRLALVVCALLAGCGGVSRSPSDPGFGAAGGRAQAGPTGGAAGATTGPSGQAVSPDQDPNLSGATTRDDFKTRAHAATLQGNLVTGVNGYTKMVQLDAADAEAAFGLAVTTLWRDMDLFAGFTANELPLTFFNTPLAVAPTLVPQPLAAEDSYLWRLLALGVDSQPPLNPQKVMADFLAEANGARPQATPPPPSAPPVTTSPEGGTTMSDGISGTSPGTIKPMAPREDDKGGAEGERGRETDGGKRSGARAIPSKAGRSGQQSLVDETAGGKDLAPTDQRGDSGALTPATPPTGPGQTSTDPTVILAQAQYQTFQDDKFETLVPSGQTYLAQRAALWFTWEGRQRRLTTLRTTLDTLLTALDAAAEGVDDGFQVEIPIRLGLTKEAYQITFLDTEYELLRQTLKHYRWQLDYRGQYTTAGRWNFLVPLEDTDADGVLSPAEYYPSAPFGTLTEAGREGLPPLQNELATILRDLAKAQDEYSKSDRYDDDGKNFVIPRNVEPTLSDLILTEHSRTLAVSIALAEDGSEVALDYAHPDEEVAIHYAPFFDPALADVRAILPPVDAATHMVADTALEASAEGENLVMGVLPASLLWESLLVRDVAIQGLIVKTALPLAKVAVKAGSVEAQTAEGTGTFTLPSVRINPLVGIPFTISGGSLTEPFAMTARSAVLVWDVSIPLAHGAAPSPEAGLEAGAAAGEVVGEREGIITRIKDGAGGGEVAPDAPTGGLDGVEPDPEQGKEGDDGSVIADGTAG